MKQTIKINFTDFWAGFKKDDNYFFNLLRKHYDVQISETPDYLFYSCYGHDYLNYSCTRIFYTAENIRPDFTACDFAISFDHIHRKEHYRLPLFVIYIDHLYNSGKYARDINELVEVRSRERIKEEWARKTKFCCLVVSNGHSKKRIDFFKKLTAIRHVDSGGMILNNVGGPVRDKIEFIKDYKFVIAFENSAWPGYVTEKLIEPIFTGCIPVYWGNPQISKDLNPKRFLNLADFPSEEALIEKMLQIDSDDEEAIQILSEPVFPGNKFPEYMHEKNLMVFLNNIIDNADKGKPVAADPVMRSIHLIKRKAHKIKNMLASKTGKQFR